jgi:hypothetical protein
MKTIAVIGIAGLLAVAAMAADDRMRATAETRDQDAPIVDTDGNLRVADDYRTAYQALGTWAVAAEQGQGAKQLHIVYASPGTIAAYRNDGRFPDGLVLVKEVFQVATGEMTTGVVSHAQKLMGWFVMVKDRKDGHPGNKLWGDGWGWS